MGENKIVGTNEKNKSVFCHFSFKRPKNADYGLFAVALYWDFDGTQKIGHVTKKQVLWENQQFITAVQSYAFALQTIYEIQGKLKELNVNQVFLVTDNSTLAGWIMDHKKNKAYTQYMNKAVAPYRVGEPKEIVLGIGLCEPRDYEKSYKYCNERYAINDIQKYDEKKVNRIDVGTNFKSVLDILKDDPANPDMSGFSNMDL